MATVSKGRTFVSGETVTPTKLNELVDNATVTSIVDADVSASAAIALSKLATGALPTAITVASANIVNGTIVADDLASSSVTQAKLASGVATTGPAFSAHASAGTSIASGIATKINLGSEDFDTNNCFASSRFTPNVEGYYQFNFGLRMSAKDAVHALLYKNGSSLFGGSLVAGGNISFESKGSALVYMNGTTDYIELFGYHVSASGSSDAGRGTFLSGFLARAA